MVTNQVDQPLIAFHFPPMTRNHTNTAERFIRWQDELLSTADNRTTHVIAVDLIDEFGSANNSAGQRFTIPEDEHGGNIEPREEHGHT